MDILDQLIVKIIRKMKQKRSQNKLRLASYLVRSARQFLISSVTAQETFRTISETVAATLQTWRMLFLE